MCEYFKTFDVVKLSLPKGRIEKGYDDLTTANKELQEEIGYKAEKLTKLILNLPTHISAAKAEGIIQVVHKAHETAV